MMPASRLDQRYLTNAARQEWARRQLARKRLTVFNQYIDPAVADHYNAPHLRYVAEKLEKVEAGEIKRLLLFMPNRHWKSSLVSMKFVAWFIGKRFMAGQPHQVMIVSHTGDKAEEFSEYARNLIKERDPLYLNVFPDLVISNTRQAAKEWGLLKDGTEMPFPTLTAGSMAAPPTGSGADLLIIDDPLKSSKEARSPRVQTEHWKTWQEGLRTRLNSPDAAVVLTMTRWNVNDLGGQLLAKMAEDSLADQWQIIMLPALAYTSKEREALQRLNIAVDEHDPLGRQPGEALWPERFPRRFHMATKANSPSAFASIGQQMPIQEGGNLVGREVFKRLHEPPAENMEWVIALDAAFKEKQVAKDDPDFNVLGLVGLWRPDGVGVHNANIVLGCLVRTQMGLTYAKQMAVTFMLAMERLTGQKPTLVGAQDTLDRVLLDELRGRQDLFGWRIRSLADASMKKEVGSFTGDKVARATPWMDRAEGGRFYVIDESWSKRALERAFPEKRRPVIFGNEPLAWQEKFFTEVEGFPDFTHDDMVDMVSVATHALGVQPAENVFYIQNIWD
jgi:hypothetical protein